MLSFIRSLGFFTAIIIILTACGDSSDSDEESTTLLVRAELPLEVLLGDFEEKIVVTAEVTGADIAKSTDTYTINAEFNSQNPTASVHYVSAGTIEVPTGSDRTIMLRAYQDGLETYRGSILTDVHSGNNPTLRITLISLTDPAAVKPKTIEATIGSGAVVITPRTVMCPINGWRQLTAEIQNELGEAVNGDVIWESSDPFVASVTDAGLVTVTGNGEALITATSGNQKGTVKVLGAVPGRRDITFFMTADPQYKCDVDDNGTANGYCGANQLEMIQHMNTLPGKSDGFCGLAVPRPRGVLVAGDLTQNAWEKEISKLVGNKFNEYETFRRQWGLSSSNVSLPKLAFRVFEGYGNHDDLFGKGNKPTSVRSQVFNYYCGTWNDENEDKCTSPIIDKVRERNQTRAKWFVKGTSRAFWMDGFTTGTPPPNEGNSFWTGGLHYSWRWDDVHFVNLNLYGGESRPANDPLSPNFSRNALRYLKNDLAKRVKGSGRPVVIMQHYGFDQFSTQYPFKLPGGDKTWSCDERKELAEITTNYNVIAFFTGHYHVMLNRSVSHNGVIDYTSGAARNKLNNNKGILKRGFLVVRLIGNQFHIQLRKQTTDGWIWAGGDSWELPMPKFTPSEPVDCSHEKP